MILRHLAIVALRTNPHPVALLAWKLDHIRIRVFTDKLFLQLRWRRVSLWNAPICTHHRPAGIDRLRRPDIRPAEPQPSRPYRFPWPSQQAIVRSRILPSTNGPRSVMRIDGSIVRSSGSSPPPVTHGQGAMRGRHGCRRRKPGRWRISARIGRRIPGRQALFGQESGECVATYSRSSALTPPGGAGVTGIRAVRICGWGAGDISRLT